MFTDENKENRQFWILAIANALGIILLLLLMGLVAIFPGLKIFIREYYLYIPLAAVSLTLIVASIWYVISQSLKNESNGEKDSNDR